MKVALDTFARAAIEAHLGEDLGAGIRAALRHYTRRLGCDDQVPPPAFPRFRRELVPNPYRSNTELELTVEPEIETALEYEAREFPGVTLGQMAVHAVMVYLADLDRGIDPEQEPPASSRRKHPLLLL